MRLLCFFSTFLYLFLIQSSTASAAAGLNQWIEGRAKVSSVRVVSEWDRIATNTAEIRFGLEFKMKPGWHTYWKNPGTVGNPPKMKWQLPDGWQSSDIVFPAPTRIPYAPTKDSSIKSESFGYERNVMYPTSLTRTDRPWPASRTWNAKLRVDYLVCEVQCIPEWADIDIQIPVSASEVPSDAATAIESTMSLAPKLIRNGKVTWKSADTVEIELAAAPAAEDLFIYVRDQRLQVISKSLGTNKWSVHLTKSAENEGLSAIPTPFEWTWVWLENGKRTGVSGVVENNPYAHSTMPLQGASNLSLWAALFFAFIGGLILNIMPCVLPVVGIKTFQLLELRKTNKRQVRRSLTLTIAGILTSFLVIAILTLILQNFGNQVGWGFQFQSPGFVAVMALIMVIFGLNLLDVFQIHLPSKIATKMGDWNGPFFEGVFATLLATPCTAPFLSVALTYALSQPPLLLILFFLAIGVGLSVPFFTLLLAPQLLSFFPKPGNWMVVAKKLFGILMLFSALWLGYVLFVQISGTSHNSKSFQSLGLPAEDLILFSDDFSEERLQALLKGDDALFVDITAEWCLTCKYNEQTVIYRDWFVQMLKAHRVKLIIVDWTRPNEKIAAYLQKHGRVGIPFSMLHSKNQSIVLPELLTKGNVEKAFGEIFRAAAQ